MTGNARSVAAEPRQHRDAVEFGHDEIEDDEGNRLAVGGGEVIQRLAAVRRTQRTIAEPLHGMGEQTALDGVVIDDEDSR